MRIKNDKVIKRKELTMAEFERVYYIINKCKIKDNVIRREGET